mmetsp:Transcript_993/g.1904  ORF Transcript_993/g.1904 Transcript_993/m.1904 type:complete len:202 (+) Transcript_993:502-1107(+)
MYRQRSFSGLDYSSFFQFFAERFDLVQCSPQVTHDRSCNLVGLGHVIFGITAFIAQPRPVKIIATFRNLLAGEMPPTTILALVLPFGTAKGIGAVEALKFCEVLFCQSVGFAKVLHIGAQVIEPDRFGCLLFMICRENLVRHPREEEYICLYALRIEYARGQAQDGMQVAIHHQETAQFTARSVAKKDVVWHNDGAAPTLL